MQAKSLIEEKATEQKPSEKEFNKEICLVIATGLCKFLFVDFLKIREPFIFLALTFWIVYIFRGKKSGRWETWGFNGIKHKGFRKSSVILFFVSVFAVGGFIWYGIKNDTIIWDWNIILILILYPVWGIVQQFIMMALIAGNLQTLSNEKLKPITITLITSVIFSAVHFPIQELALATFFMAIGYTQLYLRHRSLLPLGIFHGWLGAFFYYFVLGRNSWLEIVEKIKSFF